MINKLTTITKNTFIETLRQPIFTIIIAFTIFLYVISPAITMYTMDDDVKLLRELGLSTLFLAGLFIAVFSATGAITEEIETGTITTVLSKPVSRTVFVLGKFLGITAAVTVAHFILSVAMLMMVRHGVLTAAYDTHDWVVITATVIAIPLVLILTAFLNYSYDWNFCATAVSAAAVAAAISVSILAFIDKQWQFNPAENGFKLFDVYASVLLLLAILVLVALALMFSTRLNVVLTLSCCIAAFLLGLISDYLFGRFADQHLWAKIGKVVVPNFQVFWISDAIYEGNPIPLQYLGIGAVYAFLYASAALFLAVGLFQRRQVG